MIDQLKDRLERAIWIPEAEPGSWQDTIQSWLCWWHYRPRLKRCPHCHCRFWTTGNLSYTHCSLHCEAADMDAVYVMRDGIHDEAPEM